MSCEAAEQTCILTFPLLQPHTGCVGAAASKSAVEPQGLESQRDMVLLCRFHGTAEASRLKPCCLPSPAQLAERINMLSQGYMLIASSLSTVHFHCVCLFSTFLLSLIRLVLYGTNNI